MPNQTNLPRRFGNHTQPVLGTWRSRLVDHAAHFRHMSHDTKLRTCRLYVILNLSSLPTNQTANPKINQINGHIPMQMSVYRQLRLILCASFLQKIVDVRASQARYFDPQIASNSFACPSPPQHLQNLNLTGRQNKSTMTSSLQSFHPLICKILNAMRLMHCSMTRVAQGKCVAQFATHTSDATATAPHIRCVMHLQSISGVTGAAHPPVEPNTNRANQPPPPAQQVSMVFGHGRPPENSHVKKTISTTKSGIPMT